MARAFRPRLSPNSMASRQGSQALARGLGCGDAACPRPVSGARAPTSSGWDGLRSAITSESVITWLAGLGARRPQPLGGRTAIPAAFRYALAVSRRILVVCWILRSDHPSRPRAKTCCFFSSFKTLAMPTEPTSLRGIQCPGRLLSLAGFQVIITGRFWVIAEVSQTWQVPINHLWPYPHRRRHRNQSSRGQKPALSRRGPTRPALLEWRREKSN